MTCKIINRKGYHGGMRLLMIAVTLILLSVTTLPTQAQIYPLGPGIYDHTAPKIYYSGGTWSTTADSNNYGGSRIGTGVTTSTTFRIEFAVWGDGFELYIMRNSLGGTGDVCINSNCTTLSWYNPTLIYSTVQYVGLGYGTHQISIQKSSSTNDAINLDAIYVYPPAPAPTVLPPHAYRGGDSHHAHPCGYPSV